MDGPERLVARGTCTWPRAFGVLFIVYLVALFPLMRANFNYIDDSGRVMRGYDGWSDFSRFLSDALSHIVHTTDFLSDISPLTQLIAIAFLVAAGLVVLRQLSGDGRPSLWNLAAVIPLGLSPYFLECVSYKYDSPYMALSVFVSVAPLLLRKRTAFWYAPSVALCTVAMCSSYQASSGIFPMAVVVVAFMDWLRGGRAAYAIRFIGISALAYLIGILFFRAFMMVPAASYVSNGLASPQTVIENYLTYYELLRSDLKHGWLLVVAAIASWFVVASVLSSPGKKLVTGCVAVALVVFMLLAMFGLYPFLAAPLFAPRAMYGFGAFIALLAAASVSMTAGTWLARALTIVLAWSFVSFASSYGNALHMQQEWEDFRRIEVIEDLSDLDAFQRQETKIIQIEGTVGHAAAVNNMAQGTAVLSRLVPVTFCQDWAWGQDKFMNYYGLRGCVSDSARFVDDYSDFDLLQESTYHAIYARGNHFVIVLK